MNMDVTPFGRLGIFRYFYGNVCCVVGVVVLVFVAVVVVVVVVVVVAFAVVVTATLKNFTIRNVKFRTLPTYANVRT
jgi:hypothetical protein